jgi:serine/threonine protein kinase
MGEVYRARDGKLNRDVAIKVLPEAVAEDAERLARLQREAQVQASLNHPHIAAIYGLEKSGNLEALVLELVEGDSSWRIPCSSAAPVQPLRQMLPESTPESLPGSREIRMS